MNRPIKFRAWDGEKLYEPSHFKVSDLMQFTGLLDKNGKEIYEGDILKQEVHSGPAIYFYEVVYDQETAGFQVKSGNEFYEIGAQIERIELEVVGNIYENQELLL